MQALKILARRLKLSLVIAAIFIGLMLAGVFYPMSDEEGWEIQKKLEELGKNNLELEIFSNNMMVALTGMIPFAGPPLAGYIVFNTGRFLGWTSAQLEIPADIMIAMTLIIILLTGYGILEFLGYGIAVAESLTISYYIIGRRWLLKRELRMLLLAIALSALFLALGAVIEAALVRSFGSLIETAGMI
ncbi:MAG: stage II sporulation protein M [Nitrososphaerota archaeon]